MKPSIVEGNLLDQDVEVIVNAWNQSWILWGYFVWGKEKGVNLIG